MFNDTTPAILYRNRCYLLHFYDPQTGESAKLAHAAHYLGMSDSVSERLAQHGTSHGAKLTYAARQAGLSWVVAKTWAGGRRFEKKLKSRKNAPRELCPICRGEITLAQVLAAQPPPSRRVVGRRVPMIDARPMPAPVLDCAWCLQEQGIAPAPGASHGICARHAEAQYARYKAARTPAGNTTSGIEFPAPSLSTM
ncbi:MAG TPA: hypothetical protein VEL72_07045 [Ktedonobacteraceae bacterium]|nr:hypothetical protein [Ktedonobacteraceae bacterium]